MLLAIGGTASGTTAHFLPATGAAEALILALESILFIPRMAVLAMRSSKKSCAIGFAAKRKPFVKHTTLRRHNFRERQVLCGTGNNGIGFHARRFGKVYRSIAHSFNCDVPRPPLVSLALGVCDPSAIAGFVIPINVNAVQHVAIRSRSHIGNELMEAIPALANRDAPPAVVFPRLRVGIAATAAHVLPDCVERMRILKWHPSF
jgi:hypothetical protein